MIFLSCEAYMDSKCMLPPELHIHGEPPAIWFARPSTYHHHFPPASASKIAKGAFVYRILDIVLLGSKACTTRASDDQTIVAGKSHSLNFLTRGPWMTNDVLEDTSGLSLWL